MQPKDASLSHLDATFHREVTLYSLYRLMEAAFFAVLVFGPAQSRLGEPLHPLAALVAVPSYLLIALVLLVLCRARQMNARRSIAIGTLVDIAFANLFMYAVPPAGGVIAVVLTLNVAAAGLLLSPRFGLASAALATGTFFLQAALEQPGAPSMGQMALYGLSYFAVAIIAHRLGDYIVRADSTAARYSAEAQEQASLNELIIRRMHTGVLLLDVDGRIRLANEAALVLLEAQEAVGKPLEAVNLPLAQRLQQWLQDGRQNEQILPTPDGEGEYSVQFARNGTGSDGDTLLAFLDNTLPVLRRAESITLNAMGRFSASLAHEIRNPLTAINYAAQLMEESPDLHPSDQSLVRIIRQQTQRTNAIVESVLGIARRGIAKAEQIEVNAFVRQFVEDFQPTLGDSGASLTAQVRNEPILTLFDPSHLLQVLTVLAHNAQIHGRMFEQPAVVTVRVDIIDGRPVIDVTDRGPGIAEGTLRQLFRPFFTTSPHGTGLGLYIARELCLANGAQLDHRPNAGVGSCFRVTLSARNSLLSRDNGVLPGAEQAQSGT